MEVKGMQNSGVLIQSDETVIMADKILKENNKKQDKVNFIRKFLQEHKTKHLDNDGWRAVIHNQLLMNDMSDLCHYYNYLESSGDSFNEKKEVLDLIISGNGATYSDTVRNRIADVALEKAVNLRLIKKGVKKIKIDEEDGAFELEKDTALIIECKRVSSKKQLKRNIEKSLDQINKRRKLSSYKTNIGLSFIEVSKVLYDSPEYICDDYSDFSQAKLMFNEKKEELLYRYNIIEADNFGELRLRRGKNKHNFIILSNDVAYKTPPRYQVQQLMLIIRPGAVSSKSWANAVVDYLRLDNLTTSK